MSEILLDAEPRMSIPALKGRLGGVDYFVITLPYGALTRYVIPTDPNITDPRMRENRRPSPARYRVIAQYILSNPGDYRFSALTCTYGKSGTTRPIDWKSSTESGPGASLGILTLSQNDPLVIVDGQHRFGAIQEAIDRDSSLREESIPVVLFPYISIDHAQQLFSDLNRNAKKTTKSLDILFDHRDLVNQVVQRVVEEVPFFGERVNVEDVSVPLQSSQVFTLAGIYQATKPVLDALHETDGLPALSPGTVEQHVAHLTAFWGVIGDCFQEWGKVATGELDIRQVRGLYLHWNSGVLSAIGEFAAGLVREDPEGWDSRLRSALDHPDNARWRRSSEHWQGIATAGTMVLPRSSLRVQLIEYLRDKETSIRSIEDREG